MLEVHHAIQLILEEVEKAAKRAGRSSREITIVAVTKGVAIEKIREAIWSGLTHFGESYVQEAGAKIAALRAAGGNAAEKLVWHFIGHLQSNKASKAGQLFSLIHTIDRLDLVARLHRDVASAGLPPESAPLPGKPASPRIRGLIQVAGGASPYGVAIHDVEKFLESLKPFTGVSIEGLMVMAPPVANPEEVRPLFREVARLGRRLESRNFPFFQLRYLSMGMSSDFQVAVEEGANLLRIGRKIFCKEG